MMRLHTSATNADIKQYFEKSLSVEDYYGKEVGVIGRWRGKLCRDFGLEGSIEKEDFFSLVDNKRPDNGEQITARMTAKRRAGYDVNFNAPKSVSLLSLVDDRVIEAHEKAVNETMLEIERTAARTRVDTDGIKSLRFTDQLVWGEFLHKTSRPEQDRNGKMQVDPHLHTHAYVFNMTYDKVENKYKALENSGIKTNAPYFEAAYHSRLAMNLKKFGYKIDRNATNSRYMEVAGIDRKLIDRFSTRTSAIEHLANQLGLDGAAKANLGATSRKKKMDDLPFDKLRGLWSERLTDSDRVKINTAKLASPEHKTLDVKSALNYAINHELERSSVVKESRIAANALKMGYGQFSPSTLQREMSKNKELIRTLVDGEIHVTTKAAIKEEVQLIDSARRGRNQMNPIWIGQYKFKRDFLNDEQKNAVLQIIKSTDRVNILIGGAGVGKTTLMKEIADASKMGNEKLLAFAPSASASRGTLREEGFKTADTVASLVNSMEKQKNMRNAHVWIDEFFQLSNSDLNKIFKAAEKYNSKIILTGDPKQHRGVSRSSLDILAERAGLKVATVREIQRQKVDNYKQAVDLIQHGKIREGFNTLDKSGYIVEINDRSQRNNLIAKDYVEAINKKKSVLVVSPTHKEGGEVTNAIRKALKKAGKLGKQEREFVSHKKLNFTHAEKLDPLNYQKGMSIKFHMNVKSFKANATAHYDVVGHWDGQVIVQAPDKMRHALRLEDAEKFQVFQKDTIKLSKGEKIRITNNGTTLNRKRVFNGNSYQIEKFDMDGNIVLTNGNNLSKNYRNLIYDYTITSYSSQSKSVDQVLIAQSSQSKMASSIEQFYVSVSRGKYGVKIFADKKKELLKMIEERSEKEMSAIELKETAQKNKELERQQKIEKAKQFMETGKDKMTAYMQRARENMIRYRAMRQNTISKVR